MDCWHAALLVGWRLVAGRTQNLQSVSHFNRGVANKASNLGCCRLRTHPGLTSILRMSLHDGFSGRVSDLVDVDRKKFGSYALCVTPWQGMAEPGSTCYSVGFYKRTKVSNVTQSA